VTILAKSKLTDKQKVFCDEYLKDLNASQAVLRAGYNTKYPDKIGSQMLGKTRVKEYIEKRMREREKRTEITQDKVLNELAKIAFASGADFAKVVTRKELKGRREIEYQQVEVIDTDSLSTNMKSAISAIKETKHGISVESYDKVKALELLGKHLGMFKDTVELTGGVDVNNPMAGLSTEDLKKMIGSG
jgi:phage terminase small subunit